jgi:hypothetical protein
MRRTYRDPRTIRFWLILVAAFWWWPSLLFLVSGGRASG